MNFGFVIETGALYFIVIQVDRLIIVSSLLDLAQLLGSLDD